MSSQVVTGTIAKSGPNCISVFARPSSALALPPSNLVFSVSLPDQVPGGGLNPVAVASNLLSGMMVDTNNPPAYTFNGRRYYDFNITQSIAAPPAVNWGALSENEIAKVCFSGGTAIPQDELVQLNKLGSLGNNSYTDWYMEFVGPGQLSPDLNPFYAGAASTVSNGSNSFAETTEQVFLPIYLLSFDASKVNSRSARLNWKTSSEINSDFFGIERSKDGNNWETIGRVTAAGNSSKEQAYEFIDDNLPLIRTKEQVFYYRLRMTDLDGQYKYSDVRGVNFGKLSTGVVTIYPNPTVEHINVDLSGMDLDAGKVDLFVYDMTGRQVIKKSIIGNGIELIDVSQLPANTYNVVVKQGETAYQQRVIKID